MDEHPPNLARVEKRLAQHITDYLRHNKIFTADGLAGYVEDQVSGWLAPESTGRVLRLLRQQGKLDYKVLNRRKSLYETVRV